MFGDIRLLAEMRAHMPVVLESLIFHADDYVSCVSTAGATPDTFVDCKASWCGSHAYKNHERCVVCVRLCACVRPSSLLCLRVDVYWWCVHML